MKGTQSGSEGEVDKVVIHSTTSSTSGSETVIVKSGRRICGAGGALADTPLNQDKTYFEIKVQASG